MEANKKILVGLAGIHVDDFLISGSPTSEYYKTREEELAKAFRWGKWEENEINFAGTTIKQTMDKSITLDQHSYTLQWIEEVEFDKNKARKTPWRPKRSRQ